MKYQAKLLTAGLLFGAILGANPAAAESGSSGFSALSAQWWQWALAIPTPSNPVADTTGEDCMAGQRGGIWFLAGSFGGAVTRTCTVPGNVRLFFPVMNSVFFDTPNVCGQGPASLTVAEMRAGAKSVIDGAINLMVQLDGKPVSSKRVLSTVFSLALPEDNVFDEPCASLGGVPAGIYSPGVDDGYYTQIGPLKPGAHTLQIRADNPSAGFSVDVTYNLNVQAVKLK